MKLFKQTIIALGLALATSNAAHATIINYTYNYNDFTANIFIDDTKSPSNNIAAGSTFTLYNDTYQVNKGNLVFDSQLSTQATGYAFSLYSTNYTFQVNNYKIGNTNYKSIKYVNNFNFGDRYETASVGTLTKAIASNTAAVPEPETYAMFFAGLGLLGAVSRRRKQTAAV